MSGIGYCRCPKAAKGGVHDKYQCGKDCAGVAGDSQYSQGPLRKVPWRPIFLSALQGRVMSPVSGWFFRRIFVQGSPVRYKRITPELGCGGKGQKEYAYTAGYAVPCPRPAVVETVLTAPITIPPPKCVAARVAHIQTPSLRPASKSPSSPYIVFAAPPANSSINNM